jgi:hypothetical protein
LFRQKTSISPSSWLMVCTRPGTMVPPDSFNITDAHRLGIGLLEQVWTTDAEPDKNGTLTSPAARPRRQAVSSRSAACRRTVIPMVVLVIIRYI